MNKKIQIIRALCIFAVVMIHSNAGGYWGVLIRPFLNFAVACFLFLSGYLTKENIPNIGKFYKKRILKVAIPYSIWSVIFTVAYRNFDKFLINFLTFDCNSIYYYVFVYIQFVLLTPLIMKLANSKYRSLGFFITPIAILIVRYVLPLSGVNPSFPFVGDNFAVWFIYYYLGILLGNNIITPNLSRAKCFLLYACTIILSEIEGFIWYKSGNYDMATSQIRMTSILTSVTTILIVYRFLRNDKVLLNEKSPLTRFLVFLGDCSFGIYLSHVLIILILTRLPIGKYLFFPMLSIMTIILTAFCVFIGKKILGKRFSSYLGL